VSLHLAIDAHPTLEIAAFVTRFPWSLGESPSLEGLRANFVPGASVPLSTDDEVKKVVRDLLRHGGFKPTGRSKPASEYLLKAREKGWLAPDQGINAAVDACNVASLHSGLPISVLDLDKLQGELRVAICPVDTRYIFNPSGQEIDIGGLVSLHDAEGPCGGPVKDSQRTKTHDGTVATLSVLWGTRELPGRTSATVDWYVDLLKALGADIEPVVLSPTAPADHHG